MNLFLININLSRHTDLQAFKIIDLDECWCSVSVLVAYPLPCEEDNVASKLENVNKTVSLLFFSITHKI